MRSLTILYNNTNISEIKDYGLDSLFLTVCVFVVIQ